LDKGKIIIVEDEESILTMLSEFLSSNGYIVDPFLESKKALFALKGNEYDVLITDLSMPHIDGLQLINYIQKEYLNTLGIVITGYGSLDTAISAMRWGAFDYVLKPFKFEEVLTVVESAMYYSKLMKSENIPRGLTGKANLLRRFSENKIIRENTILRNCLKDKYKFENIIGISFPMQKVFEMIEKVADTNATVLITGESGVGKELVARAIHYNSSRKDSPLVVVNCGAIPETLLESELFGYEKGAFTGATGTRYGRFELAHGGSMFLDEIGDMSFNLQVKLLRVLQEKTFERVGGSKSINVDVRIIAATNRILDDLVKDGKFREDLYYRLNVVPIHLPPLRERRQDIPLLLNYFLERSNKINGAEIDGCSETAMSVLMNYSYPGNVRELQNLIERVVVLKKKGIIDLEDLPDKIYLAEQQEQSHFEIEKGYDTLVSNLKKPHPSGVAGDKRSKRRCAGAEFEQNYPIEKMKRLGID
jgi:DNA-binding NtrC family response regulator